MAGTATRRKTESAPEPEVVEDEFEEMEEDEDDLDDLEEVEEEETTVTATKTKATKAKAEKAASKSSIEFGSPWLAQYITETTGDKYDSRGIRMLLRKLAADGKLDREVGVTRERYSFSGPDDATVKLVLSMVKSGEAKALKQAGLDKVKEQAAAKKAAAKAQREQEAEEPEEEEMEEVEEAPKPRRTRAKTATTPAAPAKAAPSTRRRAAAAK